MFLFLVSFLSISGFMEGCRNPRSVKFQLRQIQNKVFNFRMFRCGFTPIACWLWTSPCVQKGSSDLDLDQKSDLMSSSVF